MEEEKEAPPQNLSSTEPEFLLSPLYKFNSRSDDAPSFAPVHKSCWHLPGDRDKAFAEYFPYFSVVDSEEKIV